MSRIGQILIREGLATENSVVRALGVQQFAGGRLGTLLLERGSVSEDELGRALAQQLGCEYIPWQVLGNVLPETIASLPTKFAVRHAAIPYDQGEGYLKVALRDPGDLRILDELFFVTGRKVVPAVAPEVRIYQALEKYYGERRTPRFAILAEKLSRPATRTITRPVPPPPKFFPDAPAQKPAHSPLPHEIWGEGYEREIPEPPIIQTWKITDTPAVTWGAAPPGKSETGTEEETIFWEETPPPPAIPSEKAPPRSHWIPEAPISPAAEARAPTDQSSAPPFLGPDAGRFVESRSENLVASEMASPRAPEKEELPAFSPEIATTPPAPPAPVRFAVMPAVGDFPEVLSARERDAIATAALAALARRFPRCAIFVAKPAAVSGWDVAGPGTDRAALRSIDIPWTVPSIFLNVRLSRAFYLGPLPPLPRHKAIVDAMGGRAAEECLVQPILIREKPLAFLYAEFVQDQGATPMDLAYLRALAGAAASALAASIRLKKKDVV